MGSVTDRVTPAEDPDVDTDDPDPGHYLPDDDWQAVVRGAGGEEGEDG